MSSGQPATDGTRRPSEGGGFQWERLRRASAPGLLHPWRHVTGAVGSHPWVGRLRRVLSRRLYDFLARAYPLDGWTTMNYGYAPLPGEPSEDVVDPRLPEGLALQLYAHLAASLGSDRDAAWLEVGSGRGGGAVYLAARHRPRHFVALDVYAEATALARRRYGEGAGVEFRQGDAEALPLPGESFDGVLNVESAHCYGSIGKFLAEVHRVLRPGGRLAFADFVSRGGGAHARLLAALERGPLRLVRVEEITPNVVAALAQDEERKRAMLDRWTKGWVRSFAWGAYAMEGSAMRRELATGRTVYLAALLEKPAATRG